MKNFIKVARAQRQMTQADLAGHVKVSRQTINSIETGRFIPSAILALKISKALMVPTEELFILEEAD